MLAAKQRSTLALIGIVIGVASVSSMVSVGTIVRAEAVRQFQELGTDVVNIRLRPRSRDQGNRVSVRLADARGIVTLPGISAAAPYTIESARRVTPRATLQDIAARMSPGAHHAQVTQQVKAWFRHRARHVRTVVRSAEELIEQLHQQMRLYTLLLGTVGGVSLLVGGIGVMNVMLVAVAERKVEIGIRRALGARRRDIQMQFLSEAMILSLLGGVIGAGLAVAATWGICRFTGWVFTVSLGGTALGTVVAGGAGIVFGLYPAHQAARLNPVVALQGR